MKFSLSIALVLRVGVLGLAVIGFSSQAFAEHTRVTYPNSFNVEVLGKSLAYSVNYDRVMNDDLVAGVGFGSTGTSYGISATLIPVYVNYYFARDQGSLYVTGGGNLITNSSSVQGASASVSNLVFPTNGVLPFFGIGYESRSDAGFLFRLTAYGIVGSSLIAWGGATLGFCF